MGAAMKGTLLVITTLVAMAGHAQFSPPKVIFQGSVADPQRVDTVDIDHDGDLDLLVFCQGQDRFMLARNQGSGTFDEPEELLRTPWPIGVAALADMNGDGERDLLLGSGDLVISANEFTGRISLFLNAGGAFGTQQLVLSTNIVSIHAMDVDGDGNMDILVMNGDAIFWLAGDGSGSFGPPEDLVVFLYHGMNVTVSDLDQDGLEDLVYRDLFYLGWHRNLGGGVMQDMGQVYVGSTYTPPVCGDLDNDGDRDVVILANNEIVSFLLDETMTLVLNEELSGSPYSHCNGAVLTDLNGDDLPELVFGGDFANRLMLLPNLGGGFGALSIVENEADFVNFVTAGDLDGNGTMDIIHASASMPVAEVRWNSGDGTGNLGPTTPILSSGPPYPWGAATADVDLDGDQDVVGISKCYGCYPLSQTAEVYLFENLGAELFGQGQLLFSGSFGYYGKYLALQDLNADGYVDIVLATDPGASVLMNDGAGGFVLSTTMTSTGVKDITVSDLNGDASPDVAIANDTGLEWSANNGLGGWATPQPVDPSADTCDFVLAGDVDGDTDMDLLAVPDSHLQVVLFRNNGGGAFGPGVVVYQDTLFSSSIALEDIDGDGDLDLVRGGRWFPNDGTGAFGAPMPAPGNGYRTLADVDQDGDVDIVYGTIGNPELGGYGGGLLYWRANSGTGQFGAAQLFAENQTGNGPMQAADLDGDGDLDVIAAIQGHARLAWYENHMESPYRIEGTVFKDEDLDGSYGGADAPFPYAPVSITPMLSSVMSGSPGSYTAFVDTGSFVLESVLPDPLWTLTTTPPVQTVQVTTLAPVVTGIDFGWAPAIDTSIVLPGFVLGSAPCSGTAHSWLYYTNHGTRIEQGTITLQLDPLFTFVSSIPPPSMIGGNSVLWAFDSLGWFEIGHIALEVELPPVGSAWTNTTTVTTVDSLGITTGVFTSELSGVVGCAYDPNDKQVEPQGYGIHGAVPIDTEWLTFTIRFQNTGTDTAYNVFIVDQLDDNLDRSSLQILGTSHEMTSLQIDADGEVVLRFNNIMLPDSNVNVPASQGFVRFRIRLQPDLPSGVMVENCAAIHFDFNPAVITNTTLTTLVDCDLFTASITVPDVDLLEATAGDAYQWFLDGDSLPGATSQWLVITSPGNYSVEVASIHGCVDESDPFPVITTSIADATGVGVMVHPNPANAWVVIAYDLRKTPMRAELVVRDIMGRTVYQSTLAQQEGQTIWDTRSTPAGTYSVELREQGTILRVLQLLVQP